MCSCFQVTVLTAYNPEESPAGSASTRMLDTESSKKRLFIQSSVERHSDHITTGGLGVLATMLLCPPCFLERARKPCLLPSPARVHVQAQVQRYSGCYVKKDWNTEGGSDGLFFFLLLVLTAKYFSLLDLFLLDPAQAL